jgi:hypothetical protein
VGDLWRGNGDRTSPPDGVDDGLLDVLRGALAAADPMPAHVVDGARIALSLRDLPVLPRSSDRSRRLTARRRPPR